MPTGSSLRVLGLVRFLHLMFQDIACVLSLWTFGMISVEHRTFFVIYTFKQRAHTTVFICKITCSETRVCISEVALSLTQTILAEEQVVILLSAHEPSSSRKTIACSMRVRRPCLQAFVTARLPLC